VEIIKVTRTCYRRTRFISIQGYLDKEEINEQLLCLEIFVFGLKVQRIIKSIEELPMWAAIQIACLGSTDWKSRDVEMVDKWINEPVAYILEW
jgi:hypothetical protein